jgi:hypothetical protein
VQSDDKYFNAEGLLIPMTGKAYIELTFNLRISLYNEAKSACQDNYQKIPIYLAFLNEFLL